MANHKSVLSYRTETKYIYSSLSDYITVGQAASFLSVSISTLRNWDQRGKLKAMRHPMNGYRLYHPKTLERLLQVVQQEATS